MYERNIITILWDFIDFIYFLIIGQGTSNSLELGIIEEEQMKHVKEEPENDDEYLCKPTEPIVLFISFTSLTLTVI